MGVALLLALVSALVAGSESVGIGEPTAATAPSRAARAPALTGVLTQLPGVQGCVSEGGTGGLCADATALRGPASVAISADGKSVYVASAVSDAVAVFARNTKTGVLTQLAGTSGCVSETGSSGLCADEKALDEASEVTLSPDDDRVYVASATSNAVAVFARNAKTGALTQLAGTDGCVSDTGSGGLCADGKGLQGASEVTVSPDGRSVYVASAVEPGTGPASAVAVFSRNAKTGVLTQLPGAAGCISETGSGGECTDGKALVSPTEIAVSRDGRSVVVTDFLSAAVAVFSRDRKTGILTQLSGTDGCVSNTGSGGSCSVGKGLSGPVDVLFSRDGANVYVGTNASVAVFARNTNTGVLGQLAGRNGCVSDDGSGGACADGAALVTPIGLALSRDDRNVYAASLSSSALNTFARNSRSGAISQHPGAAGCVSHGGSGGACALGRGLEGVGNVEVSPDGRSVYATAFRSNAVAVFARADAAAPPPVVGRIAFSRGSASLEGQIWVMNADGTGQTALTSGPDDKFDPSWSVDGTRIAFTRASAYNGSQIWVMNADGTNAHAVTTSGMNGSPDWSPDGRIAFSRGSASLEGQIWVMNADGTGQTALTSGPDDKFDPSWSVDGTRIAFTRASAYNGSQIWVMNADGTSPLALTTGGFNTGPAFGRG